MGFQNVVVSHIEVEAALVRFLTRKCIIISLGRKNVAIIEGLEGGVLIPHSRSFFRRIPHPAQFFHRYPEYHFSFSGKYIKKSFLQKIMNAGCRLAPWIDILNLPRFRTCISVYNFTAQ